MPTAPAWDVFEASPAGAIVVEIPHAGVAIDEQAARFTRLPPRALAAGALVADSDVGADALWLGSELHGISRLVSRTSRYVIDLNTAPPIASPDEDRLPAALRSTMIRSQAGMAWRDEPPPRAERERRVREIFAPWHDAIECLLERARAEHGAALLLSSHTFPDGDERHADVVLGTRHGATASERVRDAVARAFEDDGFSVALEEPFAGGWSLTRHARAAKAVSAVQIELARSAILSKDPSKPFALEPDRVQRAARAHLAAARAASVEVTRR